MGGSAGQLVGAVARWISHSIDVFVGTADYTPEINAPFDGTSSEEMNDLCGRCQTFYCLSVPNIHAALGLSLIHI